MARLVVYVTLLEPGYAPHLCARTGGPVDTLVELYFYRTPLWIYLLIPIGVLPFLIALRFAQQEVVGLLPFSQPVVDRYRSLNRSMLLVAAGSVAALLAAVPLRQALLAWLGIAGLPAALVLLLLRNRGYVRGTPSAGLQTVELVGVHPDFAAAVNPLLRV